MVILFLVFWEGGMYFYRLKAVYQALPSCVNVFMIGVLPGKIKCMCSQSGLSGPIWRCGLSSRKEGPPARTAPEDGGEWGSFCRCAPRGLAEEMPPRRQQGWRAAETKPPPGSWPRMLWLQWEWQGLRKCWLKEANRTPQSPTGPSPRLSLCTSLCRGLSLNRDEQGPAGGTKCTLRPWKMETSVNQGLYPSGRV